MSLSQLLLALVLVVGSLFAYIVVDRLFLSPLSTFPGPRLAALTTLYQFHFDVIKRGKLPWELIRLHERYGPIVRIGPNEVHVSDPDFYEVLYTGPPSRRHKDTFAIGGFGHPTSVITTADHDLHRVRRTALNRYFSAQSVSQLERAVIRPYVDKFCAVFSDACKSGQAVNVEIPVLALTSDVIFAYAFAKNAGYLDRLEHTAEYSTVLKGAAESSMLFRYLPFIMPILLKLPPWAIGMLDSQLLLLVHIQTEMRAHVESIMSSWDAEKARDAKHRTIFHELIENDGLPPAEKALSRLTDEAEIIVTAGTVTTVHYLKSIVYFILADDSIRTRLEAELKQAVPDPDNLPPTHVLERLPYLNAVVKEGFRITDGASSRLARIAPDADLRAGEQVIPRGTSISMSTYVQHRDRELFPHGEVFDPERWLSPESARLEKYLVPFSKGTRQCLGSNMAKSEIYLTVAALFRRFELELFETDRTDVDMAHDFFVPYARLDSKGIRVLVKRCRE